MRRLATLFALVAAAWLPVVDAGAGGDACSGFGPMAKVGTVADSRIVELSGLAASRRHAGVLWAHNDSGGSGEVFALGPEGQARGVFPITGAAIVDWEDMAVGPGPSSGSYLYLGDIGDNGAERQTVTVYRVPEPANAPNPPGSPLGGVETITLKYPPEVGPADAEALLVDPRSGELVIVTKSFGGTSRILSAPASSLKGGATVSMTNQGTIQIPGSGILSKPVTAGDVSPDGSTVVLRTYGTVLLYPRGGSGSVVAALKRTPCFGPQAPEQQGEAVAFTRDGASLVTISEGSHPPVHRSGPPAATTTTTARPSTPTTLGSAGSGGGDTPTTADATSTTGSTTSSAVPSTTSTRQTDDDGGDDDEDREDAAGVSGEASSDDGGLSPLVLVVPLVLVAGAAGLVWVRRRSAAG